MWFGHRQMVDGPAEPVVEDVYELIGAKWTARLILKLADRNLRYTELHRAMPGLSQKMLSERLRGLERLGLVQRIVHSTTPVRVEYSLAEPGRTLSGLLGALQRWAQAEGLDVAETAESATA